MLNKLLSCIKGDSTLNATETAYIFGHRHKRGLICGAVPFGLFFLFIWAAAKELIPQWLAIVLGLLFFFIAFIYVMIYYRCPRCGATPISSKFGTTGILLFPKKCAKCKAPLLPDHKWAQD
jgi:hypothetical protein